MRNRLFLTSEHQIDFAIATAWRHPPIAVRWSQKSGGFDFSKPPYGEGFLAWIKDLPRSGFFLFCRWADGVQD